MYFRDLVTSTQYVLYFDSAGVGRTGTYIALSNLYKQAQAEGEIDVFKCVHLLRAARMNMVQSLVREIILKQKKTCPCTF